MISFFAFLSSGLFLGWSLGANDASNIFGTAIGAKMIKFRTAAILSSIFVIIGAVYAGSGTSQSLGELGSIDAIGGAFVTALSAALTIYWMSTLGLNVSTSQGIVGAIIGWNIFAGKSTDLSILKTIVSTWIICPLLAGLFAIIIYFIIKKSLRKSKTHLIRQDFYTRIGLIIAGIFGAYALGANNIANIMGVFIKTSPLQPLIICGHTVLTPVQILFLLGGIAISIGICTYSKRVIETVGTSIMRMSPVVAFIVVLSQALVLFIFSSTWLQQLLITYNLPRIPLVPVSSSQAVIGAILGIGLVKGGKNIKWSILGKVALGWVVTPLVAGTICFICLFFIENVFMIKAYN